MNGQPGPLAIPVGLAEFCQRNHIQELSLFGSAITADFNADSDVDILVTFQPGARVGFLDLSRMQRELEELFGRKVDLVPKGGLKPIIRDSVLANVQVLFSAPQSQETGPRGRESGAQG